MKKTPEQLKIALEMCNKIPPERDCRRCPYYTIDISCLRYLRQDALEYIRQLEQPKPVSVWRGTYYDN